MNLHRSIIKKISFLLIVSILSLNLTFLSAPQKAHAILGVGDIVTDPTLNLQFLGKTIWEKAENYLLKSLSALAKIAARKLISMITRATVEWINNGFEGNPAYVADVERFLTGPGGVGDQVVGQFFADTKNLAFLCDPFKIQVKLALQLSYGYGLEGIGCTLTQISRNINTAANTATAIIDLNGRSITIDKDGRINGRTVSNFTRGGGWYAWLKNTLQPQNSPVGAYLIAKAEMDAKIVAAQNTKTIDLLNGQGALTYKICKDIYNGPNGVLGESREYTEGGTRPPIPPYSVPISTKTNCVVKTPGSAITGMLIQKSTTDVRQSELAAAFSDGLDQIFGALVGAVMQLALNQLKKGVLDGDVAGNNNYNLALGSAWGNSITDYNNGIGSLYNEQLVWNNTDWSLPGSSVPTSTSGLGFGPLAFGTTTMNWFSTSTTNNLDDLFNITPNSVVVLPETSLDDINIFDGYSPLEQAKRNANTLISSLTRSELVYQNNYLIAQNLLTSGRNVFASSSACNLSYNRPDYTLRSYLIRANVVTNIEGRSDSDRSIASIPWNLEVIKAALADSKSNIALLEKATNGVRAAGNLTAVTDAMIPVNSTSFNTDPEAQMLENIRTWLRGVRNIYNSLFCPIDLTKTLQINSVPDTSGQVVGGSVINY